MGESKKRAGIKKNPLLNDFCKTKTICTIGPASFKVEILEKLMLEGMDAARINTSHSSGDEVREISARIRKISGKLGRNIAIILDLQGPRIRVGYLQEKVGIKKGREIILVPDPLPVKLQEKNKMHGSPGNNAGKGPVAIPVTYKNFISDIKEKTRIFIDDGLVECRVTKIDRQNNYAYCKVISGSQIGSHKGINLPDISVSEETVTRRDREFLKLGIELGVDFIAQSFVRSPEDVRQVKDIIEEKRSNIKVIAKIEKNEAINNFDKILEIADAIMVARGDLGIEVAAEEVPAIQKDIIRKANLAGKPVITATQMLDSMIRNPRPTRAEVSDVANAIIDGSDAVMLSGETAVGKYALESVKMMTKIIRQTEKSLDFDYISITRKRMLEKGIRKNNDVTNAIGFAAVQIADLLEADAIITSTESGFTAKRISMYRPRSLIIGMSPNDWVVRQLMLSWGIFPVKTRSTENIDRMIEESISTAKNMDLVREGNRVVITAGVMANKPGSTNMINVRDITLP